MFFRKCSDLLLYFVVFEENYVKMYSKKYMEVRIEFFQKRKNEN